MDGGAAEPEQCRVDAAAQDVEHILYAGLPVGRQAPQVGAADHDRPGPQRDRLDDVTAAAVPGSTRIVAGVPSRSLPPWLDTEIAVTPASAARLASSTRVTPLTMY